MTDTTSGDQVLRALKAARSRGSNVVIRARYETEKGIRTLTADGRTGKKTAVIDGTTPVGPVQVTEIASGLKTGGLSGRKLDALIAAWSEEGADALYDVIEQEYEEGEYS